MMRVAPYTHPQREHHENGNHIIPSLAYVKQNIKICKTTSTQEIMHRIAFETGKIRIPMMCADAKPLNKRRKTI